MFNVALENDRLPKCPLGKSPEKYPLGPVIILGYDEWKYGFQFRLPEKLFSKPIQALENSNFVWI